jgi:hypothetical protein
MSIGATICRADGRHNARIIDARIVEAKLVDAGLVDEVWTQKKAGPKGARLKVLAT